MNKRDILIYATLIVFSVLTALLAVKNIKISPDSMRFGLVSQQVISGNGIRVPIIRLEDNYVPISGTIPFLDQMPLLPVLLAILGGITPQSFLAAQIINFICHVVISIFVFLLMQNIYKNKAVALLTGILVSISYPLLNRTHHISSEPLFIALTVVSIYFLVLSRNSDHYKFSLNLFVAGGCACAAILTRNAGIALIPVFLWEAFFLIKNKRPESKYISTFLSITLPVIMTAAMFFRNYMISGSLRGFAQASPERSYLEALAGTIDMIFKQFQLGKNGVILITLVFILFILFILINANLRKDILNFSSAGVDSIIVFMISYTALICLTMAKQQWRFEMRYVSPLVPFLFISCVFIIVFVSGRIRFGGFSRLSLVGMILALGMLSAGNFYKILLNLPEFSHKQKRSFAILHSCTYKWLKENYGGNIIIATNRPYHLSFFGGYSTVALPHKRFNPTIHVPEDMESVLPDRMSKFGAQVLALFEAAEEQYEGNYIARLFNRRETKDKFILVHECPDGVVYNLRE